MFLILVAGFCAAAVGFALWSLLRTGNVHEVGDRSSVNVALYRQRLAEIDRDIAMGRLDSADREAMVAELGANLLDEAALAAAPPDVDPAAAPARRENWPVAVVCALLIPVAATLLYRELGAQDDWALADALTVLRMPPEENDLAALDDLVGLLESRLKTRADDPETLYLLGHARMRQGEYSAAVSAFERLRPMATGDLSVLVSLAQANYLADEGVVSAGTRVLTDRALALNPHEPLILEMLALDAVRGGNFAAAVGYLERALAGGVEGARAAALEDGLARAKAALAATGGSAPANVAGAAPGGPAAGAPHTAAVPPSSTAAVPLSPTAAVPLSPTAAVPLSPTAAVPPGTPSVYVTVSLAPSAQAAPGARVFVIARQIGGPPMPIAVRALALADLPAVVELSDADAMQPGRLLSQFEQVEVLARLSQSGTPTRGPGDVEASSGAVNPRESPRLTLTLGG